MHEIAIARTLMDAVLEGAKKKKAKKVKAINVTIGEEDESLDNVEFWLKEMAKGTAAAGAKISVRYKGGTDSVEIQI